MTEAPEDGEKMDRRETQAIPMVARTKMARRITVRLPFPAQFARNTITHGMKFTI